MSAYFGEALGDPRSNLQNIEFAIPMISQRLERYLPGEIVGDFVFIL